MLAVKLLWLLILVACTALGVAGLEASEVIVYKPGFKGQRYLFLHAKVEPNVPREVKVDGGKVQIVSNNDKNGTTAMTQLVRDVNTTDPGGLFKIESIPNSTQIVLTTQTKINKIFYFNGKSWFTAAGPFAANIKTRLNVKINNGLVGLGDLTKEEADAMLINLAPQAPMAIADLPNTNINSKDIFNIDLLPRYFRKTLLQVQDKITNNQNGLNIAEWIETKPSLPFVYQVIARGANANYAGAGPSYSVNGRNITIFAGVKPTAGYSVSLANVYFDENTENGPTLYIEVELNTPPVGAITAQVLTSPYITIQINRNFKHIEVEWR